MPHRYSKAKARDYTDVRNHGYRAKGGRIERRKVGQKQGLDNGGHD